MAVLSIPQQRAMGTTRVQVVNPRQMKPFIGADALAQLIEWVRRIVALVMAPFKAVGRVIFGALPGLGSSATQNPKEAAAAGGELPGQVPGDDLARSALGLSGATNGAPSTTETVRREEADDARGIEVELQGYVDDLGKIKDAILAHVNTLLANPPAFNFPPEDREKALSSARLFGEETARVRYALGIGEKQIEQLVQTMMRKDPQFAGLSPGAVIALMNDVRADPARAGRVLERSFEGQLMALLNAQDRIRATYERQVLSAAILANVCAKDDTAKAELIDAYIASADQVAQTLYRGEAERSLQAGVALPRVAGEQFLTFPREELLREIRAAIDRPVNTLVEQANSAALTAAQVQEPAPGTNADAAELAAAALAAADPAPAPAAAEATAAPAAAVAAPAAPVAAAPAPAAKAPKKSGFGGTAALVEVDDSDLVDLDETDAPLVG